MMAKMRPEHVPLCWLLLSALLHGHQLIQEASPCPPGFYCPAGGVSPVPCRRGTYGAAEDAVSPLSCLQCPPQHYCPGLALSAPLPCVPPAQQPLPAQEACSCPGEGQTFQASDGQCRCGPGFQAASSRDACVHTLYEVCRDGKTRTQHGDCLDRYQWSLHCRQQVCRSAEDYRGYDGELGLCICREPPGRAACGGLCSSRAAPELRLRCQPGGELELLWGHGGQVSGGVLESAFKRWDSQGSLQCHGRAHSSRPVYIVHTTEAGFLGVLGGISKEIKQRFSIADEPDVQNTEGSGVLLEVPAVENIIEEHVNTSSRRGNVAEGEAMEPAGVLNPTSCLSLGDALLFTVSARHFPQYDVDNLYNTNFDFDWGAFRRLEEEMSTSWTPPGLFSVVFNQPGVFAFTLSSNKHKHMYVRVMPAGGQCYEPGPFFPTLPRHMTRVGISRRRNLLLRPDWAVTGGLLVGAVVILCLCVTLLILFQEYGWPEKRPIRARYHLLQLTYHMDDYASKGSRVISQRKTHRNQQARMIHTSIQPDSADEFWDYEHQVDLEAFSSNTFYGLLLKQSLSVTTRLGQLSTEVKELYCGVVEKLQLLQPPAVAEERGEEGYERLRREVEREAQRRKTLAAQLRTLLHSQLQVLRREQQAQQRLHALFSAQLAECSRTLAKLQGIGQAAAHQQQQLAPRLSSLLEELGELVQAEAERQGAWALLGGGTGAALLCPDTGRVLTKDCIFGPDGSLRACRALHCDPVTGLIRPKAHSNMLLSSGHTMAVPPDFFLHPQTGRVLPIVGNVAYDPDSSTLVFTADSCMDNRKWDSPLIPYLPYPTSCHGEQPLHSARLRGLRPGQRLQLGAPMADPDSGVPVPILAVTIHPQSGLVYPLGETHACPVTRLLQPIQMGAPMLDPRTGNVVLTVGVSLDPVTGAVLPVGGVMLAESFIEPLSGRMVRVGGASMRAGQVVPHAGGYQALLDTKVLTVMFRIVELLKPLMEEWGSDTGLQQPGGERGSGQLDQLSAAAKELQQQWARSLHCRLQLQTRLEGLLDWAQGLQQDGGALGEIRLPGSSTCVPALMGMEYPDPAGSGLSVPVLGSHTDPVSGTIVPLAGTMEDPDGKGLVAIRYGCQSVDPVTGVLAPVVGARLDVCGKTVVPVTATYWLAVTEHTDSVQVEALQREVCSRNNHWQQQRQREEDTLSDLDSALSQCLLRGSDTSCDQVRWSGRQLREAALEMQESAQAETQRRAAQRSALALILPTHVLHILTLGDEEEWEQLCVWHSELLSGLDTMAVCMEQLQLDWERWATQREEWAVMLHLQERELRLRELSERCFSTQTQLEALLHSLHFLRLLARLRADTAQAVLCGNFWYREFGLARRGHQQQALKVAASLQQKAVPLLERLNQLLEDKQAASFTPNICGQHISGLSTKQTDGMDVSSRVWTASVPVVKGISTQSLREPIKAPSQDAGSAHTNAHTFHGQTASSGVHSQESRHVKDLAPPVHVSLPTASEEEWAKLLQWSPLFQLLKEVELQMKGWASRAALNGPQLNEKCKGGFADVLDLQWECEGELIPLDASVLNPREFLILQHGFFLMRMLHRLKLTPLVSLQIASSLPNNNYHSNAFRNSFFYQEAEETLFVRRQRLQSVGGFSLLLLHCLSHIRLRDMSSDSGPAFQRLLFKVLQACLSELFVARLAGPLHSQEAHWHEWLRNPEASPRETTLSASPASYLLQRLQRPSRGLLSQEEVEKLCRKHKEDSLFSHLEGLLRERSSAADRSADK